MMSAMSMSGVDAAATTVTVREWVPSIGALDPVDAQKLAVEIIESARTAPIVILDFVGVPVVSSGFSNALFVTLAASRSLEEWRHRLQIKGLGASQSELVSKSIRAVRERVEAPK